jgi:RNA polymerase sigma factor, sigma-70 family
MKDFEKVVKELDPLIKSIMKDLHIYKNFEDFYQIGRIALWRAWQSYNPERSSFPTFAYHYIRGMMLTALRKEFRRESVEERVEDHKWNRLGGTTTLDRELFPILLEDWAKDLPEQERLFLRLHYIEGYRLKEIAERFKISYTSVKRIKRKALNELRMRLE